MFQRRIINNNSLSSSEEGILSKSESDLSLKDQILNILKIYHQMYQITFLRIISGFVFLALLIFFINEKYFLFLLPSFAFLFGIGISISIYFDEKRWTQFQKKDTQLYGHK